MKNLPFDSADYRQFQNTFLASTVVGMTFPLVEDANLHLEQWEKFTRALFSVSPMDGLFKKAIVVNRSDNRLAFIFDNGRIQAHISGDGYRSFADSVIPHAYKLKDFVTDVVGRNTINQLGIRKIDVFQIETGKGKSPVEAEVRKHFFSQKYLSLTGSNRVGLEGDESQMPNMIKQRWTEDAHQLNLRTVFLKAPEAENRYRLILDIDEQYNPDGGIDLGNLDVELKKMNMDLFNVFMGCISENVIKIMENGKE